MSENNEKCIGGTGKFAQEICLYCNKLQDCKLAEKGYKSFIDRERKKQEERKKFAHSRLNGRKPTKKDLICQYCGNTALKCKCKNKPEGRFELRTKGWKKKKNKR